MLLSITIIIYCIVNIFYYILQIHVVWLPFFPPPPLTIPSHASWESLPGNNLYYDVFFAPAPVLDDHESSEGETKYRISYLKQTKQQHNVYKINIDFR